MEIDYEEAAQRLYEMVWPNAETGKEYFKRFTGEKPRWIAMVKKLEEYFKYCEANKGR